MRTYLKTQAALIVGSLADYGVTILLVQVFGCWYVYANIAGNISGAVTQFLLSRNWVFTKSSEKYAAQIIKFILMWIGCIALSAAGVYLLTHYFNIHFLLSKTIVSVVLGLSYTYWMSKKFVFA